MTCANNATIVPLTYDNVTLANGVVTRGIYMAVGRPMQYFAMYPDLSGDDTWVSNAEHCPKNRDNYCIALYGGTYNSSQSRTFTPSTRTTWNGSLADLDGWEDPPDSFTYFNDDVYLSGNSGYVVPRFPMLTRNAGDSLWSILGLGAKSLFMDQVVKLGLVPYKGWGLWVGSRSPKQPVAGRLWLGGYETRRLNGDFTSFSYDGADKCEFCFTVTDLTYQYDGGSAPLVANDSQIFDVQLTPYLQTMYIPPNIYQNLVQVTNRTGVYKFQQDNWLALNTTGNLGNLSITMRKGAVEYKTTIPASEWIQLRWNVDDSGKTQTYNNTYQVSFLRNDTTAGNLPFWGTPFFTMNYMVMDYEKKMFKLAPARQGVISDSKVLVQPMCSGTPTAIAIPSQPSNTGNSSVVDDTHHPQTSAIVGGVVGGVAGIIVIAVLVWFLLRSKRKEKSMRNERDVALGGGLEVGRPDRTSQMTSSSPTTVFEAYGSNGHQNNVAQWLHGQPVYTSPKHELADKPTPITQQYEIPRRPVPSRPSELPVPSRPSELSASQDK